MSQKRLWSFLTNSCLLTQSYIVKIQVVIFICAFIRILHSLLCFLSRTCVIHLLIDFSLTTILTCVNSFNANCLFLIAEYKIGAYFPFPYFLFRKYLSDIATAITELHNRDLLKRQLKIFYFFNGRLFIFDLPFLLLCNCINSTECVCTCMCE